MAEKPAAETKNTGRHVMRFTLPEGLRKGRNDPHQYLVVDGKFHEKLQKPWKHKVKKGSASGGSSWVAAPPNPPAATTDTTVPGKKLTDPSAIIGVSTITGRSITLAEGVAAAKARVVADRLIPDAKTPEAIIKLSQIKLV